MGGGGFEEGLFFVHEDDIILFLVFETRIFLQNSKRILC